MSESNTDLDQLQKQIEYYFSDENLKEDAFFHRAISSTKDGFILVDILLKCNRIIKLGASIENIQNCVERSPLLELSLSKDMLRRKDNAPVPPLSASKVCIVLEQEEASANSIPYRSRIYSFTTSGNLGNAPEIRRALNKTLGFSIPFLRVGRNSGEFVCETNQKVEVGAVRVGRWRILIQLLSVEEGQKWLQHNRLAAEKAIGSTLTKRNNSPQGPVEILGRTFKGLDHLRDHLKLIINRTADGGKLSTEKSALVKEVLKFHEDPSKAQAEGEIIVDKHPNFPNTRCFFLLKNDGVKEDFSFHKCLSKMPVSPIKDVSTTEPQLLPEEKHS